MKKFILIFSLLSLAFSAAAQSKYKIVYNVAQDSKVFKYQQAPIFVEIK